MDCFSQKKIKMAYKRKYTFKVKSKSKRKTKMVTLKKQLLRMHEVKEFAYEVPSQQMLHQTYYQFSPTQQLLPGNTGTTRVGDEVYLTSLQMSGFFETTIAANASCKFRCIVFWSTTEAAAQTLTTNVVTGSAMFHPGTDTLVCNAITNPNAISVVADFIIDASQVLDGAVEIKSFNVEVPLRQTFKYRLPGSAYGKTKNLYVLFNGYVHNGVNGDTVAGRVRYSSVLKFKDP